MKIWFIYLVLFLITESIAQSVTERIDSVIAHDGFYLEKNSQNPYGAINFIEFNIPVKSNTTIIIEKFFDNSKDKLKDTVCVIYEGKIEQGYYRTTWDLKDKNGEFVENGFYQCTIMAMVNEGEKYQMKFIGSTSIIVIR